MLKKIYFILIIFVLSTTLKANFIENKLYLGAGLGIPTNDLKIWNSIKDRWYYPTNPIINLFVGYDVIKYFAIEGEFNYALPKKTYDTIQYEDTTTSYISTFFNLIGKYQTTYGTPFIKIGFGYINVQSQTIWDEPNYPAQTIDWDNNGILYKLGVGYDYNINNHNIIGLEYNYEHNLDNIKILRTIDNNQIDYTYDKSFLINQYIKITYKYKF
jgi:opacity protein-like surface antigen